MKNSIFIVVTFASISLISCKTQESAYRKAWEKAQAQQAQDAQNNPQTPEIPVVNIETPVNPVDQYENLSNNDNNNLNTNTNDLNNNNNNSNNNYNSYTYNSNNNNVVDEYSLDNVKRYSVIVGSFESVSGAEQRLQQAKNEGYGSARIIKGGLGYRVVAASFNDIQSARNSRTSLINKYGWAEGAWIFDKYK